jgi:hypothetical protein
MNNERIEPHDDDMRPEYDFSGGVRGKHYRAFQRGYKATIHKTDGSSEERDYTLPEGTVILDPDVRAYFPDADAVNSALRGLIQLIPREPRQRR